MTQIEFYETAPEGTVFSAKAFAKCAGKRVPFRFRPGGRRIGDATVIGVDVDSDGLGATWTVDLPDGDPVLRLVREGRPGFSFSLRPDLADELALRAHEAAPRDPLAGRPPTVRFGL